MSLLGKKIKLKGITQKGKNRIKEHGDVWVVLAETPTVLFSPQSKGQWLFVAPPGCGQSDKASRWVNADGDENFIVLDVGG